MSGPDIVRIKRKRTEQAPEALLVERPGKRQQLTDVHYVLQDQTAECANEIFHYGNTERRAQPREGRFEHGKLNKTSGNGSTGMKRERRTFHLKRPSTPEAGVKKRRQKHDGIAVFIEKKAKRSATDFLDHALRGQPEKGPVVPSEPAFKRPGRGASIKAKTGTSANDQPAHSSSHARANSHLQAMADSLHEFATEEAAKEAPPKPKVISLPKMTAQRSRELHRQRTAQAEAQSAEMQIKGDVEMDEDADFVYDTYVLAPSSGAGATQIDAQDGFGSIGYLVITEEDEVIWETYVEDDPSDPSDEDDENAEDWYGADYPDDELASDDEFDRDPYRYRANGSEDEWEETVTFSDEEHERQIHPWRKDIQRDTQRDTKMTDS